MRSYICIDTSNKAHLQTFASKHVVNEPLRLAFTASIRHKTRLDLSYLGSSCFQGQCLCRSSSVCGPFWQGCAEMTVEMGAGQGWAEHNARVSVGRGSLLGPLPGVPSRELGYVVSARQVHLPHGLCPAHARSLLSPAHAPCGNDLLLPDLTHGSPSQGFTKAATRSWRIRRSFIPLQLFKTWNDLI